MIYLLIILSTVGICSLVLLSYDVYCEYAEIFSRIHIGRWQDRRQWQNAVEHVCKRWVVSTPRVSVHDEKRLVLWDKIRGKHTRGEIQLWQKAALLLALDEDAAKEYQKHNGSFIKGELVPEHLFMAFVLAQKNALAAEDAQRIRQYIECYQQQDKTLPYRQNVPSVRFVDTLGFVCPYLYYIGQNAYADKHINEFKDVLFDDTFPPHAYDTDTVSPMGIYDWCRGIGWYILGLIFSNSNKDKIINLANKLLNYQRPEGGYSAQVFNPHSPFESSGTSVIGLLMVKAYELSRDKKYLDVAFRIEHSLMKHTKRMGVVDMGQGDTKGIGCYSIFYGELPFAQGMTLCFTKRLNKYEA